MSFVFRAALVIGALSWLAARRDQPEGDRPTSAVASLPALWEALPPEIRDRALREGTAEAGRRIVGSLSLPVSRDTLAEADRRPAWRGAEAR